MGARIMIQKCGNAHVAGYIGQKGTLPMKGSIYNSFSGAPIPDYPADFTSPFSEAIYANALLERIGLERARLSVEEYHTYKQALSGEVEEQFKLLDEKYYPTIGPKFKNKTGLSL